MITDTSVAATSPIKRPSTSPSRLERARSCERERHEHAVGVELVGRVGRALLEAVLLVESDCGMKVGLDAGLEAQTLHATAACRRDDVLEHLGAGASAAGGSDGVHRFDLAVLCRERA